MADSFPLSPAERNPATINRAIRAGLDRVASVEATAGAAAPATRQIISGAGLTGGGDLSADRTLAVGAGTGIAVNADDVALASMAQSTIKGRISSGAGAPEDLTGANVRTIVGLEYGLQTIWVPAAGMVAYGVSPAGQTVYSSGNVYAITFDFDQTTTEAAEFQITMPKSWDKGNVFFVPYWTATSGTGTVAWRFYAQAISDNEDLAAAFASSVTTTDTFGTANRLHIGPITSGFTPAATPVNDDLIAFAVDRDVANDTLNADARLIGVKVLYTTNAGNDS